MAKRKSDSITRTILKILGAIAAVLTVATAGWAARGKYDGLSGKVESIYASVKLNEQTVEISSLTKENERLKQIVAATEAIPIDEEWAKTNRYFIESIANAVASQKGIREASQSFVEAWESVRTQMQEIDRRQEPLVAKLYAGRPWNTEELNAVRANTETIKQVMQRFNADIQDFGQKMTDASVTLGTSSLRILSALEGANLVGRRNYRSSDYMVFRKFPSVGVNLETGEMVEFDSDSQITQE